MSGELVFVTRLKESEVALLKAVSDLHYAFRSDYEVVDDNQVLFRVMVGNPTGDG